MSASVITVVALPTRPLPSRLAVISTSGGPPKKLSASLSAAAGRAANAASRQSPRHSPKFFNRFMTVNPRQSAVCAAEAVR